MKIASYDIFDTALIRKCGHSNNIFFLLAQELYANSKIKREAFYTWRLHAEDTAKKINEYPKIKDIYDSYPANIFMEYSKEYVIGKEYEVERKNLVGVPVVKKSIETQRKDGWKIVFISDMYLDASFLKSILMEQGLFEENDEIFVSSEFSASKADGKLFDLVSKSLNPQEWKHTGDNIHSDVRVPSEMKIKASHLETPFTNVEKRILNSQKESQDYNYYSIIIGLCRYARVVLAEKGYNPEFSADFVAPIYLSFLLDVLNIANNERISRLYFWARDGWILYELAKILNVRSLDIRYFYASRKSLYLPSLENQTFEEFAQYWGHDSHNVSFRKIVDYFDLEDIFSNYDWKKNNLDDFKKILCKQDVKNAINDKIQSRLKLITAYFQQEGLMDDKSNYAFVDIGWKGSGLYALNKLEKRLGVNSSSCFYWGTLERYRGDFPICFYTHGVNRTLPDFFINLIEDYFSANPQLSTKGYKKNSENKVEPIFDETSNLHNEEVAYLNLQVATLIAQGLVDFNLQDEVGNVFAELENILLNIIKTEPYLLDIKDIHKANCKKNEGERVKAYIRKIDLVEVVRYMFGGTIDIIWPEASVCYTYPRLSKYLLKFHLENRKRMHNLKSLVKKISNGKFQ